MVKYVEISNFTEVITGGTPSTVIKEYWEKGNINWLSSGDLNQGIVNYSTKKITELGYKNSSTKMMPIGTVAIALTGATTGVTGILNIEACGNQSVTGILPSSNHDSKYLYYYIRSIRDKIINDSFGGAQPHINQQYVKNIKIPLFELDKQKQIAKTLDKANELIELRKESITKLDAFAKSIFIDMFGDPVSNPKGWEIYSLTELCKFENGDRSSKYPNKDDLVDDGIIFLSSREIVNFEFKPSKSQFITESKFMSLSQGHCNKGDIIFTLRGNGLGKCCIFKGYDRGFINAQMVIIRCNQKKLRNIFLINLIKNDSMFNTLLKFQSGSAQPQLSVTELKKLKIICPCLDLQNKFAKIIEKIEEQKSLYTQELEKLQENFDALLQKSFQ